MTKKAVLETEVVVPVWSNSVLIRDCDAWVWLATWLGKQFKGRIKGDEITYGKMRITVEALA